MKRALLVSPTEQAQEAAERLRQLYDWTDLRDADLVVALGGDGFMLQTLHRHGGLGRAFRGGWCWVGCWRCWWWRWRLSTPGVGSSPLVRALGAVERHAFPGELGHAGLTEAGVPAVVALLHGGDGSCRVRFSRESSVARNERGLAFTCFWKVVRRLLEDGPGRFGRNLMSFPKLFSCPVRGENLVKRT